MMNQVELNLEAGNYLILPTTTTCMMRRQVLDSSHTGDGSNGRVEVIGSDGSFSDAAEMALCEMFHMLDEDMDELLSRYELNSLQQMMEGCDLEDDVYEWIIDCFDSRDGGLTADGLVQLYSYMYDLSRDVETLWRDFVFMGFDETLKACEVRAFVVSIHSLVDMEVMQLPFDEDVFEEAMGLAIKASGEAFMMTGGQVVLYASKNGCGVSLAVDNMTERDIRLTLDCSESINVISNSGYLIVERHIIAGETKVMLHLMQMETEMWTWRYRVDFVSV